MSPRALGNKDQTKRLESTKRDHQTLKTKTIQCEIVCVTPGKKSHKTNVQFGILNNRNDSSG